MKTINVGIIGLGFMAATHLKAWLQLPGVRIAALCNPSGRNLDGDFSQVAGNVGDAQPLRLDMTGVQASRDFATLLDDPVIDVIDICTPTPSHPELALRSLAAGKHVLCEKPLARTSLEARRIGEAARSARGFIMPAMCVRFWPDYALAREAARDGRFGKVLSARFRRVADPPAWGRAFFLDGRQSGGALLDLHIHDADFILDCFGVPAGVFSSGYSIISGAVDHLVTQYCYPDGPMVVAEGGWCMAPGFGFRAEFTLNFERATLDFDTARGAEALRLFEHGQALRVIPPGAHDGYYHQLEYFVRCIREGIRPARVTVEDGVRAVALCEAEEQSIRTGARVDAAGLRA